MGRDDEDESEQSMLKQKEKKKLTHQNVVLHSAQIFFTSWGIN
jgi:hypothetical protein